MQNPITVPNKYICREIGSVMIGIHAMDLHVVGRSESPLSRNDLNSYANIIAVGRNAQIISYTESTV